MYAVIMAGGKGERLWPKSSGQKAKHMLSLGTKNVMLQETIKRLQKNIPIENIFIITTKNQFSSLKKYTTNIKKENMLLEPIGRDTAPAILLSALVLEKRFGNVTMAVLPSDHLIKDINLFYNNLLSAEKIAGLNQCVVTIGIKPRYASVGYGYIETGKRLNGYYEVKRFIEKPKKQRAEKLYKKDNYLWNSGIFIFRTSSILKMFKTYMPNLYYTLKDACSMEGKKGYNLQLANQYSQLKPISIDYGIMEPITKNHCENIFCVKASFDWIDVGSWSTVEEIYDKDKDGNIILANCSTIDVKNSIILGDKDHKIGAIGLKDVIVVQTQSGTLVCNKNRAQEVKDLVKSFSV